MLKYFAVMRRRIASASGTNVVPANVAGGEEHNVRLLERCRPPVRGL